MCTTKTYAHKYIHTYKPMVGCTMEPTRRFDPISKDGPCNSYSLTTAYEIFGAKLKLSYDTVFPLTCNKTRSSAVFKQPRMTPALLRSAKTKSKLHAAFIKTPNSYTKHKYVTYRNKFKTLRNKMEKNYYAAEFAKHNHNLKQTWHTIKSIL